MCIRAAQYLWSGGKGETKWNANLWCAVWTVPSRFPDLIVFRARETSWPVANLSILNWRWDEYSLETEEHKPSWELNFLAILCELSFTETPLTYFRGISYARRRSSYDLELFWTIHVSIDSHFVVSGDRIIGKGLEQLSWLEDFVREKQTANILIISSPTRFIHWSFLK